MKKVEAIQLKNEIVNKLQSRGIEIESVQNTLDILFDITFVNINGMIMIDARKDNHFVFTPFDDEDGVITEVQKDSVEELVDYVESLK